MSENTNNTWMVYRHISPSGKVYIGISRNSPTIRWGRMGAGYKKTQYFGYAIQKYGWENIKHEVLFSGLSEKKAKQLEIDLIRHYKNLGISYNITDGGDGAPGWHPSEELKKQWSEKRKGRIIDTDWRKKLSDSLKGRIIPIEICKKGGQRSREMFSKAVVQLSLSGEYIATFSGIKEAAVSLGNIRKNSDIIKCCKGKKRSCSKSLWMYKSDYDSYVNDGTINTKIEEMVYYVKDKYKYLKTEEHREKLREACKEARSKPLLQMSTDNCMISVYSSGMEAERQLGYDASYIGQCCNGKYDKAYGYKWKYITKEEYNEYKQVLDAA